MADILIDGNTLTIDQVAQIAIQKINVSLGEESKAKINESQGWVNEIVESGKPVYGINTGFGIFSNKDISIDDIKLLNRNLILSHAVGTGPDLPEEIVRAAILIRANTLAKGHSGIRLKLVEALIEMLNRGVTPVIPSQGSLGSSGDLAQLSHLAMVLTCGENDSEANSGWAYFEGKRVSGKKAMEAAGIERIEITAKEGLAITNGATFSAGIAALAIHRANMIIKNAEVALALSLEALLGVSAAFDARLHDVRNQVGQIKVASRIRELTEGSTFLDQSDRVQDSYSLRCAPQVHGPARDTLEFVSTIITREINAVTDNPLLFEPGIAISGGNFHGEPIANVMDYLKIALSEIGAISERRTFQLTDAKFNGGLPAMLVADGESAGLNSGVMMPQYTAASLVLENQHLAAPNSIHSLPTSGGKEDHNANSMTAARNAYQIARNCTHILAIEIFTAARAIDLRKIMLPESQLGMHTGRVFQNIRSQFPLQKEDAFWTPHIEGIKNIIWDESLA